jgi:hypothetical protein
MEHHPLIVTVASAYVDYFTSILIYTFPDVSFYMTELCVCRSLILLTLVLLFLAGI